MLPTEWLDHLAQLDGAGGRPKWWPPLDARGWPDPARYPVIFQIMKGLVEQGKLRHESGKLARFELPQGYHDHLVEELDANQVFKDNEHRDPLRLITIYGVPALPKPIGPRIVLVCNPAPNTEVPLTYDRPLPLAFLNALEPEMSPAQRRDALRALSWTLDWVE